MGYIYWDEVIQDIQTIPTTTLNNYIPLLAHKPNKTAIEKVALITIQKELERRDGI